MIPVNQTTKTSRRHRRRKKSARRGVALIMVLGALTILTVMLTEFQEETAAELGSAISARDSLKAEYAARSGLNLSRLLIASEPTMRKAIPFLALMFGGQLPQLPVWQFGDQVLGAFNDKSGGEKFAALANVDLSDGRNLGLQGAGFEVQIVDEDSKINLNVPARGDAFTQTRVAQQIMGLIGGLQYSPMFDNRDADGEFSDRQAVCAAIIDWVDPDQQTYPCDLTGNAQQTAPEDSHYQLLDDPYKRKNAAFDSLEELRLVRGISDDFWHTFVEPDHDNPADRTLTVWGQGRVNVNTANPVTILSVICGNAPEEELCTNPEQQAQFLMVMGLLKGMTQGAPIFGSPKVFLNVISGKKGGFGDLIRGMGLEPIKFRLASDVEKSLTTESKVFSITATGRSGSPRHQARVVIRAVVDFRAAPPPGVDPAVMAAFEAAGAALPSGAQPPPNPNAPADLTEDSISDIFRPNPGGDVIYYRVD